MPGKDGTGPAAGNKGRSGKRGGSGAGPAGNCVCPKCGKKVSHTAGKPCTSLVCPNCGSPLIRDS